MQIACRSGLRSTTFDIICEVHPPIPMGTWILGARRPTSGSCKITNPHVFTGKKVDRWSSARSASLDVHPPPIYRRSCSHELGRMTYVGVQLPNPTYLRAHVHQPMPQCANHAQIASMFTSTLAWTGLILKSHANGGIDGRCWTLA